MMVPKLYYDKSSPTSRTVLLTLQALDLNIDLIEVNLKDKEQFNPDFLELNPHHTVPTLVDDDLIIWDSHAISSYLVAEYGSDDALYPKDVKKRALVDQRLHFDSGILFPRLWSIANSILYNGTKSITKDKSDLLIQSYTLLETLLERKKFVAGSDLSIADFAIVTTISSACSLVPLATNRFPNIVRWLNRIQNLPYYDQANREGLEIFINNVKCRLA